MPHASQSTPPWLLPAAMSLALAFLALQCLMLWPQFVRDEGVFFRDPDDYMRLVRVRMIQSGQSGWRIHRVERAGWPDGSPTHWTMPQDLLILGLSRFLSPWAESDDKARDLAGLWIGPALQAALLAWLGWWAAKVLGALAATAVVLLFVLSGSVSATFGLARPDHQSLILAASAVGLCAASRAASAPKEPSGRQRWLWPALSGVAIALGLWTTVETALMWAVIALGWGLAVLTENDDETAIGRASAGLKWSVAGLLAGVAFYLIEYGGETPFPAPVDCFSIPYLLLWLVPCAWFGLARRARRRSKSSISSRWVQGLLSGAILSGAWLLVWKSLTVPAESEMAGGAHWRWFVTIDEMRPLVSGALGHSLREINAWLGWTVWALPPALVWLWRARAFGSAARWQWTLAAVGYTALALCQRRWSGYASLTAAVVVGAAIGRMAEAIAIRLARRESAAPRRAAIAVFVLAAILGAPGLIDPTGAQSSRSVQRAALIDDARRVAEMTGWLRRHPEPAGKSPRSVMAPWWMGSQILYQTDLPVVATPYQGNMSGIVDAAGFFLAPTDAEAADIARKRQVGYVLAPSHGEFLITDAYLLGLPPEVLDDALLTRLRAKPSQVSEMFQLVGEGSRRAENVFGPYRLYRLRR
jgi:hypothetical protein